MKQTNLTASSQTQHRPRTAPTPNCRRGTRADRRVNTGMTALKSVYRRRRAGPRRDSESTVNCYADTHNSKIILLALGACLLCTLDAFFTSILISNGSYELNPFMDAVLQHSFELFLFTKLSITAICISALVMHKNHLLFNRISGYQLLVACFLVYLTLVSYEISMIRHLPLF